MSQSDHILELAFVEGQDAAPFVGKNDPGHLAPPNEPHAEACRVAGAQPGKLALVAARCCIV